MKRIFWSRQLPIALLAGGLLVTAAAWQTAPGTTKQVKTDTVPDRDKKVRDIDDALEQIEQTKIEVEKSLKQVDAAQLQKQIREAMKEVDAAKMKAQIDGALREVDMVKIKAEIQHAMQAQELDMKKMKVELEKELAGIDAQKINAEAMKAIKEIDMEKIRAEVDESLKSIDIEKIKQSIDRIDMEKMKESLKDIRPQIEASIGHAREGIRKAETEIRNYKGLIDALDRDGLINKKETYTIEWKNETLSVNGKKQSSATAKKYSDYLQGHKSFTIKKQTDDFSINDNDNEN